MLKKSGVLLALLLLVCIFSIQLSNGEEIEISGESAILMDVQSGRVMYSNNSNTKMPMASTTKIMTALVAIENGNLDDIVKIKGDAVGIEGSSIYLYQGEEISLRDLLYGLMLRSGNDSAIAIAQHIGGSVDNFIVMMNKKAKEIGAHNTNFTNPHGLSNDNHYTTAYDFALITREALKNKEFKAIVQTKLWVSKREKNKYFQNKNKTLWQYEGGDGVKIGYTKKAGRCLVASATRNNMQLIAVVLNDNNWFNNCYKLFDYGFENFIPTVIQEKNQYVQSIIVKNGKRNTLPIITEEYTLIPLKDNESQDIKVVLKLPEYVEAPIFEDEAIGSIEVYLKGKLISKHRLVAAATIESKTKLDRVLDFLRSIFN